MKNKTELLPILSGIGVSLIFGLSFAFTDTALDYLTPMHLIAFRFAFAALTLTVLSLFGIIKVDLRGKEMKQLMLLALFQPVIYFICETWGVKMTSASESGMLIATIPVAVAFFAYIFLGEKTTIPQIACILLSVGGVMFIVWRKGTAGGEGSLMGILFLIGAVIAAGIYNILSRKLSTSFKPLEITFVMMWVGAITFNFISIIQHAIAGQMGQYLSPLTNGGVIGSLLYLGILSSVGAFFLVNFMLSKMEASRSAIFSNLTTVVAIIAGVTFRGDPFTWYHAVGGLMIIAGVYGTNYFGAKKRKRAEAQIA